MRGRVSLRYLRGRDEDAVSVLLVMLCQRGTLRPVAWERRRTSHHAVVCVSVRVFKACCHVAAHLRTAVVPVATHTAVGGSRDVVLGAVGWSRSLVASGASVALCSFFLSLLPSRPSLSRACLRSLAPVSPDIPPSLPPLRPLTYAREGQRDRGHGWRQCLAPPRTDGWRQLRG
jgi:hypothetical protein